MNANIKPIISLTADELAVGLVLQQDWEQIDALRQGVHSDGWQQRMLERRHAFIAAPSSSSLSALRAARIDWIVFYHLPHSTDLLADVHEALRVFGDTRLRPWVSPILLRGARVAVAAANEVRRLEEERHFALTGRPLRNSEIVQIAEQPAHAILALAKSVTEIGNSIATQPRAWLDDLLPAVGIGTSPINAA